MNPERNLQKSTAMLGEFTSTIPPDRRLLVVSAWKERDLFCKILKVVTSIEQIRVFMFFPVRIISCKL